MKKTSKSGVIGNKAEDMTNKRLIPPTLFSNS